MFIFGAGSGNRMGECLPASRKFPFPRLFGQCLARVVSKRARGAKMPVAVMTATSGAFSYRKLLEQCETQELEAPGGITTSPVYAQLLALYLLHNDMNNARYLWKRIPTAIKSLPIFLDLVSCSIILGCPAIILMWTKREYLQNVAMDVMNDIMEANLELGAIWAVGQRIWQRDFPGIYTTIDAYQWSESIQPIMEALKDATRRRAFGLVSRAYPSISADDFAAFVGLPVEEAVKGVLDQGWQADLSTRMIMPKKPGPQEPTFNRFHPLSEPAPVPPIPNEQQLARLTDYVAFLEN